QTAAIRHGPFTKNVLIEVSLTVAMQQPAAGPALTKSSLKRPSIASGDTAEGETFSQICPALWILHVDLDQFPRAVEARGGFPKTSTTSARALRRGLIIVLAAIGSFSRSRRYAIGVPVPSHDFPIHHPD
ncbi:MAG: hypothetical protein WD928_14190, partial [Gammaproteobacteria bacterium]